MKNPFKTTSGIIVIVAAVFLFMAATSGGQQEKKNKLGHINAQELLSLMPERQKAQDAIEKHGRELEDQLALMQADLKSKYEDYRKKEQFMSDAVKQSKVNEITDLEKRIQEFQLTAQEDYQKKNEEVLAPLLDKANKAIQEVAEENGYTYIFDTSAGVVLYWDKGDNVLPLVKKKMGIP